MKFLEIFTAPAILDGIAVLPGDDESLPGHFSQMIRYRSRGAVWETRGWRGGEHSLRQALVLCPQTSLGHVAPGPSEPSVRCHELFG